MLSAGRQDFSRAAGGAAGLPRKESLRLFQPQAEGNAFRGTLCQAALHAAKKHKGLRQGGCANLRRKMACRLCFALPRCARDKEETGTILSLAWQKRRFARSGLGSEACKPARLRRPAQVCRSDCAQNRVAFGSNTTPACRQTVCPAPACLGKMATTLAARFLRGTAWRGHLLPLRRTSAPLLPVGVAPFEQYARGRGRHVRTASRQSAACNNAPALAVLFADAATIQTIRLLRRLRVLSVRRGNVIMIRARVFIYISMLF